MTTSKTLFLLGFTALSASLAACAAPAAQTSDMSASGDRAGSSGATTTSAPSGPEGLYAGEKTDFVFQPNVSAPGGGSWVYKTQRVRYLLAPGGRAYVGAPLGGLEAFDVDAACAKSDAICGRWSDGASAITVDLDAGTTIELAKRDGALRTPVGIVLRKVGRADGVALRGAYGSVTGVDASGAGGRVLVSSEHTIAFEGDRFAARGFVGFASDGAAGSSEASGDGTYSLSGNTLRVRFADGTSGAYTFWIDPEDASVIVVDGVSYAPR
jgi:hypothetical protein